ncbi:MAG: leukotoxin LktA family filamentous adhesin, partial [Phascolarctobacterium sp.]
MSSKRKGLRYSQKRLDYKRDESASLRMKVLRSVLAVGVGFALTPWLGREAYAESNGIVRSGSGQTNLIGANGSPAHVADIYAESAANGVGLNAFKHFELGNNQIANLYFRTASSDTVLNTLVNTVENRISISGTVNAIRNNTIGGNLYFLSPKGMVVGSTGVINAGSLTVMTSGLTFGNAQFAAQAVSDKVLGDLDSTASIDIHGKINAATGIDLRAAYINVTKASGSDIAPALKTGVVFANTVNTTEIDKQAGNIVSGSRLAATVDDKGNIVIADPSNPTGAKGDAFVKGDGSIKLAAYSDSRNTNTSFLGVTSFKNTVESKVEVGNGATIDALGNVDISATASITAKTKILHFVDLSGYAKASVNVDGAVTGTNVNISSSAKANYSGGNFANILDVANDGTGQLDTNIQSNLTNLIWGKLEKAGKVSGTANLVNNIVNQLYMPFNLCDAEATTTIGSNANIQAKALSANNKTVGGDVNIKAASAATNKMKVGLAPKINKGDQDFSKY